MATYDMDLLSRTTEDRQGGEGLAELDVTLKYTVPLKSIQLKPI